MGKIVKNLVTVYIFLLTIIMGSTSIINESENSFGEWFKNILESISLNSNIICVLSFVVVFLFTAYYFLKAQTQEKIYTAIGIFLSMIFFPITIVSFILYTYVVTKTFFRKNTKNLKIVVYLTIFINTIILLCKTDIIPQVNINVYFAFINIYLTIVPLIIIFLNYLEEKKYNIKYETKLDRKIKKKVVFGITSLKIGGAERALVDLIKKIYNVYDITIYTIYGKGTFEKEIENLVKEEKIKLKTVFKKESNNQYIKKLQLILIYILKPIIYNITIKNIYDVEVAFVEGIITRMFSLGSRAKKVAWVHSGGDKNPYITNQIHTKMLLTEEIKNKSLFKKWVHQIDKRDYLRYNDIVFVSGKAKENFLESFGKNMEKNISMSIIYKYLDIERIKRLSEEYIPTEITPTVRSIVTVAKIIPEKGIDRLLNVHEKLIKDGIIHKIYVLGDGPDREKLINETKKRKLKHSFRLIGALSNPYPYIKGGDYFALLSKTEGYGIVIDEAKVLKKEILITKTASVEAAQQYDKIHIFENTEEDIYNGIKRILKSEDKSRIKKKDKINKLHIFKRINDSKIYDIMNILNK